MRCTACGLEIADGAELCGGCGAARDGSCPQCGFANPPGFKFCGQCGGALRREEPAAPPAPAGAQGPDLEAERRHITVVFCDLVESTNLSASLDPEELREIVHQYQSACVEVVERFDGYVAQYLGDGLLIYFGYPSAHEDDARRAVHAGLGFVETMVSLNRTLRERHGVRLAIRVGIHTGMVVTGGVGAGQRTERLALGQTPNVAARLQALAAPDTVLLSAATHELAGRFFECQPLGPKELKGISEPVEVFRAVRARDRRAQKDREEPPPVGRDQELALLRAAFDDAREGRGRVVLLSGEAGIGKSRVVLHLRRSLPPEHSWQVCQGSSFGRGSAFQPVLELIAERSGFRHHDPPELRLEKLERFLEDRGLALPEAVPLLAAALSMSLGDRYQAPGGTPQLLKQKTLDVLLGILLPAPGAPPAVLVFEDLHWFDPSTLELLDRLVERASERRMLALLTFRPDFSPPWEAKPHLRTLELSRLGERQVEAIVSQVTGAKLLPPEVLRQILDRTDGIPLFVAELTRMLLESGHLIDAGDRYEASEDLPSLVIPATLHDSLTARLDRLGAAKGVAQVAAVLGREFSFEMLHAVAPMSDQELVASLDQLLDSELFVRRGSPPEATYQFSHALIQDAAYSSMLKSTRRYYHEHIADVLVERFPRAAEIRPELVARHYTEAGAAERAVGYWLQAARRAARASANLEAADHAHSGLTVLAGLPGSRDRDLQELELQTTLAGVSIASRGYADPGVERAYSRARELCQAIGRTPQLFLALWGLFSYYLVRGQLGEAIEMGRELEGLAASQSDPLILLTAHVALGVGHFYRGELEVADRHLEQAIALDPSDRDRSGAFATGQDVGVVGRVFAGLALWCLGRPDRGLRRAAEAIAIARRAEHPFTLAFALHFACCVRHFRREPEALRQWAEEVLELAQEHGFPWWISYAQIHLGWCRIDEEDDFDELLGRLRGYLEQEIAMGALNGKTHFLALLSECALAHGRFEAARSFIEMADGLVRDLGERHFAPEVPRLRGELVLAEARGGADGAGDRAEACFREALEMARGQSARSLELRAANSLARLWQGRGRRAEARALLERLLGEFDEGFDTPDLREAAELVQTL